MAGQLPDYREFGDYLAGRVAAVTVELTDHEAPNSSGTRRRAALLASANDLVSAEAEQ